MENEKIYGMLFNKVFPMLIAKAERKGRKKDDAYIEIAETRDEETESVSDEETSDDTNVNEPVCMMVHSYIF